MPRPPQIFERTGNRAKFASHLSGAALCAILLCCSGCLQHKISIESGYRLTENAGAPMLVPTGGNNSIQGEFQASKIVLPGASAGANQQCAINGEVFSLRPSDLRHWIVRSPSLSGWNTLAGEIDIDGQWSTFTRDLERMKENGCFPSDLTTIRIRTAIAQRIPLPAIQVPSFFYSQQGLEFIDLAPGMEVRLQQILPSGKTTGPQSKHAFRMLLANYAIVPSQGEGLQLKLTQSIRTGTKTAPEPEVKGFFSLSRQFAPAHVLRLSLKGFTGNRPDSDAILIGASSDAQLNAVSRLILQTARARCVDYPGTVCISFPRDALSLFSTIWINGRKASYPFGSAFGAVLRSLPQSQQSEALRSARVFRELSPGHYAEIEFPRTPSGASQLLLLPADRIQWKH